MIPCTFDNRPHEARKNERDGLASHSQVAGLENGGAPVFLIGKSIPIDDYYEAIRLGGSRDTVVDTGAWPEREHVAQLVSRKQNAADARSPMIGATINFPP
jgi:hypothetical protein